MRPGIGADAAIAPQQLDEIAVHDAKLQAEFLLHLVAPVDLQPRRTNDENLSGAISDDEFLYDQPRLNRLAKPTSSAMSKLTRGI